MVIGSNNEKKEMCSNQDQTGKQSLIGRKWVFIKETNIPAELYKWQMNWKQYPIHQAGQFQLQISALTYWVPGAVLKRVSRKANSINPQKVQNIFLS